MHARPWEVHQPAVALAGSRGAGEAPDGGPALADRIRELTRLSRLVSSSLDPRRVLEGIVQAVAQLMGVPLVALWVADEAARTLHAAAFSDAEIALDLPVRTLGFDGGAAGWVATHRQPLAVPDVLADGRMQSPQWWRAHGLTSFFAIPVIDEGRLLAVLALSARRPIELGPDDRDVLENMAAQAAVAIRNARLFAESDRRRRAAEALAELGRGLAESLDPEEVGRRIIESVHRLLDARMAVLYRVEPGSGDLVFLGGAGPVVDWTPRLAKGTATVGLALRERRPVVTPNLLTDDRIALDPDARARIERSGYRAVLAVPLFVGDRPIGAVAVGDAAGRIFDEEEVRLVQAFADQAALALRNAELLHESTTRQARLEALLQVNRQIATIRPLGSLLATITEACGRLVDADSVGLRLVDGPDLVLAATWGDAGDIFLKPRLKVGEGVSGTVAATGEPLNVPDAVEDPRRSPEQREAFRRLGYRAWLGVPVKIGDRVAGVLAMRTRRERGFFDTDLEVAQAFADQAAIALENAQLYGRLEARLRRLRTLTRLNQLVSSSLDPQAVLGEITRAAAELLDATVASFWRAEEGARTLTPLAFSDPAMQRDVPATPLPYGEGLVGQVAQAREAVNVSDALAADSPPAPQWWRAYELTSFFGLPVVHEGVLLGVLALAGRTPFRPSAEDEDLLASFVAQAAVAISNARLYAGSEARRRAAEAVAEIGRVLAQTLDPEVVAQRIVDSVPPLLGARSAAVYRLEAETGNMVVLAVFRGGENAFRWIPVLPPGIGTVGLAARERHPDATPDLLANPRITFPAEMRARIGEATDRARLTAPLLAQGRVIGAVVAGDRTGRVFTDEEIQLLQTFADQAALALEGARLYREAEQAVGDLRAKNVELDNFTYSVSHDLKAPLVAVQGMTGALVEDCVEQLDEQGRHYVARLQANVLQMERLIGDLLALSRVGRESRPAEAVDLEEVVEEVLLELAEPIGARGVAVTVEPLAAVWGVRTQVAQVVRNLLSNAVKYTAEVERPEVVVGATARGEWVEGWVRDNGIGIEPAYHGKVFEIFQRLHDVEVEGTGVGLAIVKKIVEGVGGRVWVESAKAAGATFRFTWPRGSGETPDGTRA